MDKSNNVFIRSRQKTMQKMINDTIVPISLRKRRIKKILFGQLEPFFYICYVEHMNIFINQIN